MSTQAISVNLPSATVYVSGTVNGTAATWTMLENNVWQAIVPRAADDVYQVELELVSTTGAASNASFTLYYGVLNLVTDRTQADVDCVLALAAKGWAGMTDDEKAEWETDLKGAYNASDLNRVQMAMEYVAGRFEGQGYVVELAALSTWTDKDIPAASQMENYLSNLSKLRSALTVMQSTPPVPAGMDELTYVEANNIEQILLDLDHLLTNIAAAWFYSGDLYLGEV